MISKKTNAINKYSNRPYYDRLDGRWKVDFPDRTSEEGDLLYVAGEFVCSCLIFPYNDSATQSKEYCGHSHYFEGVIEALLNDPVGFTIEGFEGYYSSQEKELLYNIQEKLLLKSDSKEGDGSQAQ